MKTIKGIKIQNFKKFNEFSIKFNNTLNLLIGDNEAGKSTILSAIDIVLSGSRGKVEALGLENLFNIDVIEKFLRSGKKYENLPILFIELYLNDQGNIDLDGKFNSLEMAYHGLRLECAPRDDLSTEIKEILRQDEDNFPFEYYSISYKTFSGNSYTGYRKFMQHLLLDSTQINNEYATKSYIKTLYQSNTEESEKNKYQNEYRKHKESFKENILANLNRRVPKDYNFAIRTNSKSNLQTDLTIKEGSIDIENKGKGRQCFIKTDFALQKNENELDIILLEEPENHLSHIHMKKLIRRINESENKQLFIATHSNLISTRLNLRKSILLNSSSNAPVLLKDLPDDTAKFFMKAPDNNILEFILSNRVILVEGDAEFILIEAMYERVSNEKLEDSGVNIISVGGTSFKRYLDIAILLNIKTAVVRDNDGDYQTNCIDRYVDYDVANIEIFSVEDNTISTFEISIYNSNKNICDELFLEGRRTLTVQQFMLDNKADCAFELLDKKADSITTPSYMKKAIEWIRK
jgi:putative ATP-dependent endonuclease of OLD family